MCFLVYHVRLELTEFLFDSFGTVAITHLRVQNFTLATTITQLAASWRLTFLGHDNYTNNNFDFQANVIVV